MCSTGIGVLIAITLGTTYAGYSNDKKPERSFQNNISFLEGYDSRKPHVFSSPQSVGQTKTRYTMVYFKGSPDVKKGTYSVVKDQDTQKGSTSQTDPDYEIIPMTKMGKEYVMRSLNQYEKVPSMNNNRSPHYTRLFGSNNESQKQYWFPSSQPIVEDKYNLPKETISGGLSQGDSWYQRPQASLSLMDGKMNDGGDDEDHISTKLLSEAQMGKEYLMKTIDHQMIQGIQNERFLPIIRPVQHIYDSPKGTIRGGYLQGDNWHQSPQALMSLMDNKTANGDNYEQISTKLLSEAMAEEHESSGGVSEKNSGKKQWVEHTKPYEIEVVKKTGVPEPQLVKIPVPQVVKAKTPHPYAIYESVPVPVAIPIYKLVPEYIEKKVPIEVEKLVPVYKDKPYNVTMEKIYPVYVKKPYPVYETIYKHVYKKSKPSHSGFVRRHHKHHRSRGWMS